MPERVYRRPPWAARTIGARLAARFNRSVSRLSVRGRVTGRRRTVPVAQPQRRGPGRGPDHPGEHPRIGVLVLSQCVEPSYAMRLIHEHPDSGNAVDRTHWPSSALGNGRCPG